MVLVGELLEEISRHPPAIGARKLLVEHYITIGWLEAATDNANELKKLAPKDKDVQGFLTILSKKPEPPAPVPERAAPSPATASAPGKAPKRPFMLKEKSMKSTVRLTGNLDSARQDLSESYTVLRSRAKFLIVDLLHLQALQKKKGLPQSENTSRIQAIAQGHAAETVVGPTPPASARSITRSIQANPESATELAITDLEEMMKWLRAPHGKASGANDDAVREALVKRVRAVESALPDNLKTHPEIAFMHVQHEHLGKSYVNTETMLGDEVKDIPRENFWVTEDNYAWDMDELAQAITANGGVMRNPLSKVMFTPKDIRGIVTHPLGSRLAALQVEQRDMAKGVRMETITQMENLAKVLLDDQSSDALPSRHAVDEFMAYTATRRFPLYYFRCPSNVLIVPELEQKALDGLKCPAKDSHTGQSYDFSIGEAVRDAKGNRVCFHKTGDFIKQAAAYLRENRGAPPDTNGICAVM
jgi:hypothetical protein